MKTHDYILIAAAMVCLMVGIIAGYKFNPGGPPEIISQTGTVTRWVTTPTTPDEYRKCALAPLSMSGEMRSDWLYASCTNGCQSAEKGFQIRSKSEMNNFIFASYLGVYTDHGLYNIGGINYYRRVYGPVWAGGGVYAGHGSGALQLSAGIGW